MDNLEMKLKIIFGKRLVPIKLEYELKGGTNIRMRNNTIGIPHKSDY